MPEPPSWEPVATADGVWTLRHAGHGQACHSLAGAWQESRERYAIPCELAQLARARDVVRLLDVGTGLGLNLAAALAELEGSAATLEVLSLERDPSVFAAGARLAPGPAEVERWHAPVRAALARAAGARAPRTVELDAGGVRGVLRLVLGDARRSLPALQGEASVDAVFLDPFSRAVEPELWSGEFLGELARRMSASAILSTYSSSLSVRRALLGAGLRVGAGGRVGSKHSGTLARREGPLPGLPARLERRLRRAPGGSTGAAPSGPGGAPEGT